MTNEQARELIEVLKRAKDASFLLDKITFYVKNIELEADEETIRTFRYCLILAYPKNSIKGRLFS